YLAPGVYVEIQKGTPPIAPVGTSTPGFIGQVPDTVPMPPVPGAPLAVKDDAALTALKAALKGAGAPDTLLARLDPLKGKTYSSSAAFRGDFLAAISAEKLSADDRNKYLALAIDQATPKVAADPTKPTTPGPAAAQEPQPVTSFDQFVNL